MANKKVVTFCISVCGLRVETSSEQFAHYERFAGIAGWNARLPLLVGPQV
jgi:hypothetical protein